MIIHGKIADVREQKSKKGEPITIVDITRQGKWDPEKKAFGPEETVGVMYLNSNGAQLADWAANRKKDIGKMCVLSAQESTKDGKTTYFGRYLPTTYGMVHSPAEIRKDVADSVFSAAVDALEDCLDAGELPEEVIENIDYKNADSIASIIQVLDASSSTVAKSAAGALRKLIIPEQNAYIGKIASAKKFGTVFKVSFATPRRSDSEPVEWNSVAFFNTAYSKLADRAEKVLNKGDNVVLILSGKGVRNGQPSYVANNFHKLT